MLGLIWPSLVCTLTCVLRCSCGDAQMTRYASDSSDICYVTIDSRMKVFIGVISIPMMIMIALHMFRLFVFTFGSAVESADLDCFHQGCQIEGSQGADDSSAVLLTAWGGYTATLYPASLLCMIDMSACSISLFRMTSCKADRRKEKYTLQSGYRCYHCHTYVRAWHRITGRTSGGYS